jgi:hypothetical protein
MVTGSDAMIQSRIRSDPGCGATGSGAIHGLRQGYRSTAMPGLFHQVAIHVCGRRQEDRPWNA